MDEYHMLQQVVRGMPCDFKIDYSREESGESSFTLTLVTQNNVYNATSGDLVLASRLILDQMKPPEKQNPRAD